MPWVKVGPNKSKSSSGKIWTKKQIAAYKATNGFKRKPKKK